MKLYGWAKQFIGAVLIFTMFIGLKTFLADLKKNTNAKTKALQEERLPKFTSQNSRNPIVDVKLEILRQNPNLAEEVEELISSSTSGRVGNKSFHKLFDYLFVLSKHSEIAELLYNSDASVGTKVEHLDVYYLLPAYLHERMGLVGHARANYRRYINMMKIVKPTFSGREYQRRLTVARLKFELLPKTIPTMRTDYYADSYIDALIEDFFEYILRKRRFLDKYSDFFVYTNSYYAPHAIDFSSDPIYEDKQDEKVVLERPYIFYGQCASHLRRSEFPEIETVAQQCSNLDILISNEDVDPFLRVLSIFLKARILQLYENYGAARNCYSTFLNKKLDKAEFLRDDAMYLNAVTYLSEGRKSKGISLLFDIQADFKNTEYDSVAGAKELADFEIQRQKNNYENYLCVQVGAHESFSDAIKQDKMLKENSFKPMMSKTLDANWDILHRVFLGPMKQKDANNAKQDLKQAGITDIYVRTCSKWPRQPYFSFEE